MTWHNRMYIYGGQNYRDQIVTLDNACGLEWIGQLKFDFKYGACAVDNNDHIYLCFSEAPGEYHKCRRSTEGPVGDFDRIRSANYDHAYTRIASSGTQLFALGDGRHHAHGEFYLIESDTWIDTVQYPFGDSIYGAPIQHVNDHFIVFGGYIDKQYSTMIAMISTVTQMWTQIGHLNNARVGHSAIMTNNNAYLIIGGKPGLLAIESCSYDGREMICTDTGASLEFYCFYPELHHVPDNYCTHGPLY